MQKEITSFSFNQETRESKLSYGGKLTDHYKVLTLETVTYISAYRKLHFVNIDMIIYRNVTCEYL